MLGGAKKTSALIVLLPRPSPLKISIGYGDEPYMQTKQKAIDLCSFFFHPNHTVFLLVLRTM